jgi:hypothetical protein
MVRGESYDQAIQNVIQAANDETTHPNTSGVSTRAALMAKGASYDQATNEVLKTPTEPTEVINNRWNKHLAAMTALGAHEAGWAASASN